MEKKERRSGKNRRSGAERRQFNDLNYKGPERRSGRDRRSGKERRKEKGDEQSTNQGRFIYNRENGERVVPLLREWQSSRGKIGRDYV